jgi:hypothetical protein
MEMMTSRAPTQLLQQQKGSAIGNNRGSVLIGIVIVMVIVGAMGGALLTMNSTSSVSQFGSMDGFRAFYLAESGGQYAIPVINKNIDDWDALNGLLNDHTFTFSNGDRFHLALSYTEPVYTLVSTGILDQGTRELNATRQITYRITKQGTQIDFPFDTKEEVEENFTFDGKKGKVREKKELDGNPALQLKWDDTDMRLNWGNPDATLPDLAAIWETNDKLLSYDMQIKLNIMEHAKNNENPEFLTGLTFRDSGNDMYGLSILKHDNCSGKDVLPSIFCNDSNLKPGSLYVVLWSDIGGAYSLIDSHEIKESSLLDGTALNAWSTLFLHLEEEYIVDANGNRQDLDGDGYYDRQNLISGSLLGSDVYARGVIDWDPSLYQEISWDSGASNPITDSSLTTETFGIDRPPEIGLHNFLSKNSLGEVYVDDFSIQFNSSAGAPSYVEQY